MFQCYGNNCMCIVTRHSLLLQSCLLKHSYFYTHSIFSDHDYDSYTTIWYYCSTLILVVSHCWELMDCRQYGTVHQVQNHMMMHDNSSFHLYKYPVIMISAMTWKELPQQWHIRDGNLLNIVWLKTSWSTILNPTCRMKLYNSIDTVTVTTGRSRLCSRRLVWMSIIIDNVMYWIV